MLYIQLTKSDILSIASNCRSIETISIVRCGTDVINADDEFKNQLKTRLPRLRKIILAEFLT